MAQGSRFSSPKFNGGGLWDPRSPGVAWPEPISDEPYVKGVDGMASGCSACKGGMGQIDFSKFQAIPKNLDLQKVLRPDVIEAVQRGQRQIAPSVALATPAIQIALQQVAEEEKKKKKKRNMLIIGGAVAVGIGIIFLANRK